MEDVIGIVGQGFVGTAVHEGMKGSYRIETYDRYLSERSTCASLADLAGKASIIFVCVPTPMRRDGSCDTSIVESVVRDLSKVSTHHIVAIKSTVPPGTTDRLNALFGTGSKCEDRQNGSEFQVVFQPEFLTEATANADFANQNRIIIGGPRPATTVLNQVFRKVFPEVPIVKTSAKIAEMVKMMTNNFLAVKVSFANEMYQICQALGEDVDYDKVVEYAKLDPRLGNSHWAVPGPMPNSITGEFCAGFSGSCFVKDLNSMISLSKSLNVDPKVMRAAWEKNLEVRPERDWETLKGRAVVDDE